MKEHLNFHSIANAIRLKRTQLFGSFIIVEGDTDARFYKNFTQQEECRIEIAFNKENAIKVLETLQVETVKGIIAIVDTDFDILEGKETKNPDLFLTDFHDLECLIFVSPALEKVLSEFGSEEKMRNFGKDIRELIFEIGTSIGCLRWISLSDELNLTFEDIDFGKFVKKDNLTFDLNNFITTVKNKSQRPDLDNLQLASQIKELVSSDYDKRQISCGKDLVEVLTIALQKVLGTKSKENPIDSERINQGLRLAYEFEFFTATELYNNVKEWENRNEPFKVFR